MAYEFAPEIIDEQREFAALWPSTEAGYHLGVFGEHIKQHGPERFMVLKVGGGIIDDEEIFDSLLDNVALLHRIGLTPIIVHGGGKQITRNLERLDIFKHEVDGIRYTPPDTIPIIAQTLNSVNEDVRDRMELKGLQSVSFHGRIQARYKDRVRYGEVGDAVGLDKVAVRGITEAISARKIPVISCLGHLASDDLEVCTPLNVNADTAAVAVARTFKPLKYMAITPPGGVLDKNGKLIPIITPEGAEKLIEDGVIDGGMKLKIEGEVTLVNEGTVANATVVSSHAVLHELFSHEGHGTLITKTAELKHYSRNEFDAANLDTVAGIIERAFNEGREPQRMVRLADDYFSNPDISYIIRTLQSADGVGIIHRTNDEIIDKHGVRYLDKLAVIPEARGHGIALDILENESKEQGLFWRASSENPYLVRYTTFSDGSSAVKDDEGKIWHVFWKNIPYNEELIARIKQYAQNKRETLVPMNREAVL